MINMVVQAENNVLSNDHKAFLFLYSGQAVSLFGSSITNFVIIWWIAISSQSVFYLALASLFGIFPEIILSPIIGVLIDRLNNNKIILFFSDFLQALLTTLIIFSFYSKEVNIWFILILLLFKAILQSFHTPTFFTVIPMMVPKEKLSRTNSLMSLLNSLVNIVSPIVAASLLVFFSIANILWIDLITFLIAVIPLLLVHIPRIDKDTTNNTTMEKTSIFTDLKEGILYLKNKNGLLPLLFSFAIVNASLIPIGSYMVLLIEQFHNGTSQDYASVLASFSFGILLTSLVFTKIKINNVIRSLIIGIVIIFVGPLIIAFTPKGVIILIMLAQFITGGAIITASISSSTLWQKTVEFTYQGRVNSLRMSLATMAQPLGIIIGGIVANSIGLPGMYFLFGISGLITFLCFVMFTNIRYIGKIDEKVLINLQKDEINVEPWMKKSLLPDQ